jgi:septal ring factor EnvC (AmiA/AmiB activator)
MPPRPGQIDELSQSIGRLEGLVEGIDKYVHDREHSINNLVQKVDSLGTQITREVTRMKAELQVQLDAMDRRIAQLEADKLRREGAIGLIEWVGKNYPFLILCAGLFLYISYANGLLK